MSTSTSTTALVADLPAHVQDTLCDHDLLVDAVAEAVMVLHGCPTYISTSTRRAATHTPRTLALVVFDDDSYRLFDGQNVAHSTWVRAGADVDGPGQGGRLWMLQGALDTMRTGGEPFGHVMSTFVPDESPAARRFLDVFLHAWWQMRMTEGHTLATAHMLLGLTVPAATLPQLHFPVEGGSPKVDPWWRDR